MNATVRARLASLFQVHPGEGWPVLLLLTHALFKGVSQVFFETAANTYFLHHFTATSLPYVYLLTAGVSVALGLAYAKVEERTGNAAGLSGGARQPCRANATRCLRRFPPPPVPVPAKSWPPNFLTLLGRVKLGWRDAARIGLAVMFLFTAASHFSPLGEDMAKMIPPPLTGAMWVIYLTGVLEAAGAIGLLLPRFRRTAAWCLLALLVAMFPANIHAALNDVELGGRSASPLWWRASAPPRERDDVPSAPPAPPVPVPAKSWGQVWKSNFSRSEVSSA